MFEDEREFNEAFAGVMKKAIKDEGARHAVANKIVKFVNDDIQQKDLASMLLPKDFVPLGTTAEYAVKGKLKAYWHEPGSYAPRSRVFQRVMTIPTSMVSAHPEYELGQLESGRYGGISEQVRLASEAITGAVNAKIWNTLTGSVATTAANYSTVDATSHLAMKSALDNAINWCEDQAGGGIKAIVGRRNLLYRLLDLGTTGSSLTGVYSDSGIQKIQDTGVMATYRGIPLIGLPQWRDAHGKHTIAQDEIMCIGGEAGKYVVAQELRSQDAIEIDTLVWHMHMHMRVGVGVLFPERLYRIKIT